MTVYFIAAFLRMFLSSVTSNSDLLRDMKAFKTLSIHRIMSEFERAVV